MINTITKKQAEKLLELTQSHIMETISPELRDNRIARGANTTFADLAMVEMFEMVEIQHNLIKIIDNKG